MKTIKYLMLLLFTCTAIAACKQDQIDYYDPQYDGVRFPGNFAGETNSFGGTYDVNESKYIQSFTFRSLENPDVEYTDLDVVLVWMGIPPAQDTKINVGIEANENNAQEDQYEILSAYVPEGENYGSLKLRIFNSDELLTTTRQLNFRIRSGDDYMMGPNSYLRALVMWNANVTLPAGNTRITYNMLIKSPVAWSSTSTAYASPKAVSVILDATGWEVLPNYGTIYTGNLYQAWAKKVEDYIAKYNAEHPDDILRHDAGTLIGEPIEARIY